MTDIKITYIVLETLLFIVFLISGYLLSKSKSNLQYWRIAILPIIAFAVISGLRFGREIDYNLYYFNYKDKLANDEMELIFRSIVNVFNYLEIPYYGFVLFCSTFLIISVLYFLTKFKNAILFTLPLFLGLMGIENLIRWYLAFSFVLIGIKLLMDSRYFIALVFTTIAILIHTGIVLCLSLIILFYFLFNKKILNQNVAIILFAMTLFLGSVDQLISIASVFNSVNMMETSKTSNYIENAQDIASGGMSTGIYSRGLGYNILIFISYAFPIYFGGKYLLKDKLKYKEYIWLYNLAVFSIIIMPVFSLVEVFNRISAALMFFSITFVGISTFFASKQRYRNQMMFVLLLISFLSSVFMILKNHFYMESDSQMLFIWDANGRNYLPI